VPEATGQRTLILTKTNGSILNFSQSLDTQTCFLASKTLDFGQNEWSKFLDQIFVQLTDREVQTSAKIQIWTADEDADDAFVLSDEIDLVDGNPFNCRVPDSRFFRIHFVDLAIKDRWKLSKFTILGDVISEEY